MEPKLLAGTATEDWTGDARYFEYSRAANPVGSGHIPAIPLSMFPAADHQTISTGIVAFDTSEQLGISDGPATSPALLASFIRIAPGDSVDTAPCATSELYRVISGSGVSTIDGRDLHWSAGDFFVLPANSRAVHTLAGLPGVGPQASAATVSSAVDSECILMRHSSLGASTLLRQRARRRGGRCPWLRRPCVVTTGQC